MSNSVPYLITQRGVTVFVDGKPISVDRSEGVVYENIVAVIKNPNGFVADMLDVLLASRAEMLKRALEKQNVEGVVVDDGEVRFNGKPIHGTLAERMLDMAEQGFNLSPMKAFLTKLMQNPSKRAVDGLYDFLEYGRMPITSDGDFLAYKAVRGDWKDIHSGTIDNSVGTVVEVPRNEVDEDPDRTCSHGLHVCSHEYLPSFVHANGHVVICKINPKDVVAVPRDYNNTKMRVCRYEVIEELEDWYDLRDDQLGGTYVWDGDDADDDAGFYEGCGDPDCEQCYGYSDEDRAYRAGYNYAAGYRD